MCLCSTQCQPGCLKGCWGRGWLYACRLESSEKPLTHLVDHWHQRGPQLGQSANIPTHFLTAGWLNSKSKHPKRIRWKPMAFLWLSFISHMVSLPTIGQGTCKGGSSSKRGDIDPTTWQKGCQCHTVRTAGGRRYIVAAIFGKYNLSQQSNYTFSKAKYNVPTQ